ncbi:hypothetical protein QTL86_11135 [Cellulosilyticum sp. ST5]|uniref:hypothetical protein n=1 Tax=Cellulosilyticum sp. ST5 TaxID=3055805 RepID=UPI0039777613
MVLIELITILKNDTTLKTLLKAEIDNTKIMPMPLLSDGIGYNFIPLLSDGIKEQSQFEITIINKNLFKCCEIKERLDKLLITIGDTQLTNSILEVSQNGGGCWYDGDLKMFKLKANYTILSRKGVK